MCYSITCKNIYIERREPTDNGISFKEMHPDHPDLRIYLHPQKTDKYDCLTVVLSCVDVDVLNVYMNKRVYKILIHNDLFFLNFGTECVIYNRCH